MATENAQSVADFFRGKNVFITGGTGFIGKMMIEKLLRSCPEVGTIYLLAREKKNKTATERVQELTDVPLFDIVRRENPKALQKIELVEGDISEKSLGMSEADQQRFCEKINVIIHSAATISFKEPLKVAVATNVQSVKELMGLARRAKHLHSFVHVSTAFTNWFRLDVEEKFYKPKYDPNQVMEWCRNLSDAELKQKIPNLDPHLSTYTFSKSLAEYLVSLEGQNLPMAVVRPSIVAASAQEPHPGWIDNWGGSTLFGVMIAKGFIKNLQMRGDFISDTVPADTVVNMTLAAAYAVGTDSTARTSVPVIYHCATGTRNPVYWGKLFHSFEEYGRKYPMSDAIWYPKVKLWKSGLVSDSLMRLMQYTPAHVLDVGLKLAGKKPRFVKTLDFTYSAYNDVKFAPNNPIYFRTENTDKLIGALSASDLRKFDFEVKRIDWDKFCEHYYMGMRRHLCNDKSENYPALRQRVARLKVLNYLVLGTTAATALYLTAKTAQLVMGKGEKKAAESATNSAGDAGKA